MCKNARAMEKWDDLKFVLAIAKAGGITKAARSLAVTHSTVSRRLASLEARLGTRLFERLPDGYEPTSAGQDALASARLIENELHALDTRITAQDAELEGPLRVTAAQLLFQTQVADIMKAFSERHPRIQLEMNAANEILSLHRREADVAIRVTDKPDPALFGRRATGQNRAFYISKAVANTLGEALLVNEASVALGCVAYKWWGRTVPKDLRAKYPNAYVSVVTDDMISAHAAVRAGLGIGRMPCFLGDPDPDLIRVPGLEVARYFDIWLLTHPDLKNVARIRAFLRFAADAFKDRQSLYLGK